VPPSSAALVLTCLPASEMYDSRDVRQSQRPLPGSKPFADDTGSVPVSGGNATLQNSSLRTSISHGPYHSDLVAERPLSHAERQAGRSLSPLARTADSMRTSEADLAHARITGSLQRLTLACTSAGPRYSPSVEAGVTGPAQRAGSVEELECSDESGGEFFRPSATAAAARRPSAPSEVSWHLSEQKRVARATRLPCIL
jgi:hypothetical protein